jgi:hypothetical protein
MTWKVLVLMFLLVPLVSASAYVDPGTGSMIVQAVIAAFVTGAAFVGAFWRKLFRRRPSADEDENYQEKQ